MDRIALEHLLVGSAITGSPAYGGGGLTASPGSGTGPASTDSYLFSGGDTRTPVAVLLDPPARSDLSAGFLARYGRRPVVAVLDTGVRAQPLLDVAAEPGGGYDTDPGPRRRRLHRDRPRHPGRHPHPGRASGIVR